MRARAICSSSDKKKNPAISDAATLFLFVCVWFFLGCISKHIKQKQPDKLCPSIKLERFRFVYWWENEGDEEV